MLVLITQKSYAQTFDEIKNDRTYMWGYGTASNLQAADRNALKDLIGQISTTVESKYEYIIQEEEGKIKEAVESIVRTYSSSTLSNAKRLVIENDESIEVLRFIKECDMNNIFRQRESRIKGYVMNALNAEKEGRVGDALRYYYWAQVLLNSHPDNQQMFFNLEGYNYLLFSLIPDRINRIFSMISIQTLEITNEEMKQEIIFNVYFQNKKAYNIDYTYWNGSDWSALIGASEGKGIIQFFGEAEQSFNQIRVKIEYQYVNKCRLDPDLPDVIEVIQLPYYKNAVKIIDKQVVSKKEAVKGGQVESITLESTLVSDSAKSILSEMSQKLDTFPCMSKDEAIKKIETFIALLNTDNDSEINKLFSDEGLEIYQRLIKYGKAKAISNMNDLNVTCIENDAIVRSVPFMFSFPSNHRKFVENLSFTFDSARLIKNITFSLNELSMQGILSRSKWLDATKWHIIDFLENYQTAYALERLDYIDKIFSDDALIIVGKRLVKAEPIDKMYAGIKNEQYQFIKVSKKEFLERLNNVFRNNEFVNIQFEECLVSKRDNSSEVYGIQIAQNYYSTNYADKGYLFLMVDLNDTLWPKIYVRSWQPEKNPDGSIIGLGTFFN